MREAVIGMGGAAGDGLDKSGDTIARTASRLGLHVYAYNSYQSIIRGGHIWLRIRLGEEAVQSHGDRLNVLIALNQDSIERHAPEVEEGGAVIYNSDRLHCDLDLLRNNILTVPLPVREITAPIGKFPPIMQNTVLGGAVMFLCGLDFDLMGEVLTDTFRYKGEQIISQNIAIAKAGYNYAKEQFVPLGYEWSFSRIRRPFLTGNEAFGLGAVAAGCKFYSAYPMTPASGILHWMASHAEKCGVVVKQCEDELAVVNMAVGAGVAGVRAMCATSGGGFALMTEAIGQAAMIEAPVVVINVQRGGPSTGIPTKTEQADLNQVYGASQGDYPRVILAPTDTTDCYYASVESLNLAEKYQIPVLIVSDLLLSEHPQTVGPNAFKPDVPIERGQIVREWPEENGPFKRYKMTPSGISPRSLPGTANTLYVSATDDHDEEGILISDEFTSPPIRRKIQEKRMKKIPNIVREFAPPATYGPEDAEVTLLGWGSTKGVIAEAVDLLNARGTPTNQLQIRYLHPFQSDQVTDILKKCRHVYCVEVNYSAQFARHLRAETGLGVDGNILRYDGEPLEPEYIVSAAQDLLAGREKSLDVTREEVREMTYHYIRTHLDDAVRPGTIERHDSNGYGEPVWVVDVVFRKDGNKQGDLTIGVETGATYAWHPQN